MQSGSSDDLDSSIGLEHGTSPSASPPKISSPLSGPHGFYATATRQQQSPFRSEGFIADLQLDDSFQSNATASPPILSSPAVFGINSAGIQSSMNHATLASAVQVLFTAFGLVRDVELLKSP